MELLEFTGRVGLAALLGTLIGLERQFHRHQAGPRTNALVSTGAALFVSLTALIGETTSPSRIASYIVSGVGFLGGGAILKEGANVRGLTTAAVLWCSAAVGTLSGTGNPVHALLGAGYVIGILVFLRPLVARIDNYFDRRILETAAYRLRVVCRDADSASVRAILDAQLGAAGLKSAAVAVNRSKRRTRVAIRADVTAVPANDRAVQDVIARLLHEPGVTSASWERLTSLSE